MKNIRRNPSIGFRATVVCGVSLVTAFLGTAAPHAERGAATRSDAVTLPQLEVRADRITDFGMSIRTNFGVLLGEKIKWMRVGVVIDGSSAALAGLHPDDQILLIDERKAPDLSRDEMLATFFGRSSGERMRLVVRDAATRRYRSVDLRASAKGRKP